MLKKERVQTDSEKEHENRASLAMRPFKHLVQMVFLGKEMKYWEMLCILHLPIFLLQPTTHKAASVGPLVFFGH